VGGAGELVEARLLQRTSQCGQILNSKLNFDFLRHVEILTAERAKSLNRRGRGEYENGFSERRSNLLALHEADCLENRKQASLRVLCG
jgi:hypothetical protein